MGTARLTLLSAMITILIAETGVQAVAQFRRISLVRKIMLNFRNAITRGTLLCK